ncbi:hypothetical protein G5C51_04135 [Streptomyces sp. A7024]|uniref:phospholipase D n=1 Tax=Streptomyces coryli TaxID=1128680 RepID=A0A6G4TSY2_9ACTN|nr:phospholipase D-like domain-containing protein [Streptomyces coryli]NGN63095.1 hypothetical protein [Streptomyces coryli]
MRRFVRTVLVLGAIGGLLLWGQPAHAGQRAVSMTIGSTQADIVFNDPVALGGADPAQIDHLVALINGAPADSTIHMAISSITLDEVYNAIAAAVSRGVRVQVVQNGLGRDYEDSTPTDLATLLGANHRWCDHGSSTLAYGAGCLSRNNTGLMHAKYILFSRTKDSSGTPRDNVVWFGTPNMTNSTGKNEFNDSFTFYGDRTLYTNFSTELWTPMWNERSYSNDDFYDAATPRGYFGSSASHTQVYASPEQNTDLVVNRLNYITADDECRIRVMEAAIADSRPAVTDKIVALKRGGCRVWVGTGSIQSASLAKLKNAGIPVRKAPVHDKTIIVYAKYAGSAANRTLVFTGSHNITYSALHYNDEILVKVEDSQPMYDAFYDHFNDAYNTGSPL